MENVCNRVGQTTIKLLQTAEIKEKFKYESSFLTMETAVLVHPLMFSRAFIITELSCG